MQENTVERLLIEKNEQGMDALLLHYGPLMRYIIAPILQNPQDREDCLSEVSMRVWEKIGQFDGEKGSFRAWLTAITRNTALNHARKVSGSSTEELSESMPSPEPTPEEALLKKERQEALSAALNRLSYKDRLLFYRKYYLLLSAVNRPDSGGAWHDRARRRGKAVSREKAASQKLGR